MDRQTGKKPVGAKLPIRHSGAILGSRHSNLVFYSLMLYLAPGLRSCSGNWVSDPGKMG